MELQQILRGIRRADLDYDLIREGDRIAVGVSGGKDSMVLLTALHMYTKFKGKHFTVVGVHIDLGFPDTDFSAIVSFCETQGIEFHQFPSKVYEILKRNKDKDGCIKCSLCSKFKKATVNEAAKQLHCNKVAFGHHSDDAVETLFMNAIYGGKLATFLPKMYLSKADLTFIRPLIYAYEQDIVSAQQRNHIPFVKSGCPNDGYTQRQTMKELLQDIYRRFPSAKQNFLTMLYNEEQLDLWHKSDGSSIKKDVEAEVLKTEGMLSLAQRGPHYFLVYPDVQHPSELLYQSIDREAAWAALQGELSLKELIEK